MISNAGTQSFPDTNAHQKEFSGYIFETSGSASITPPMTPTMRSAASKRVLPFSHSAATQTVTICLRLRGESLPEAALTYAPRISDSISFRRTSSAQASLYRTRVGPEICARSYSPPIIWLQNPTEQLRSSALDRARADNVRRAPSYLWRGYFGPEKISRRAPTPNPPTTATLTSYSIPRTTSAPLVPVFSSSTAPSEGARDCAIKLGIASRPISAA